MSYTAHQVQTYKQHAESNTLTAHKCNCLLPNPTSTHAPRAPRAPQQPNLKQEAMAWHIELLVVGVLAIGPTTPAQTYRETGGFGGQLNPTNRYSRPRHWLTPQHTQHWCGEDLPSFRDPSHSTPSRESKPATWGFKQKGGRAGTISDSYLYPLHSAAAAQAVERQCEQLQSKQTRRFCAGVGSVRCMR